jgi:hypothetical protein
MASSFWHRNTLKCTPAYSRQVSRSPHPPVVVKPHERQKRAPVFARAEAVWVAAASRIQDVLAMEVRAAACSVLIFSNSDSLKVTKRSCVQLVQLGFDLILVGVM